jgi:hypothetical protein
MNLHREWFSEYGKYNGGDLFLGDESKNRIMGHGRVKMLLKDGRIRTLPGVLHILDLVRSLIFVSKLDDAGVDNLLGKGPYKMVRGEIVLMRGFQCGNLYKLLGRNYVDGCNNTIVHEQRNKQYMIHTILGKNTMWHKILGNIGDKGLWTLHDKGMVEGMYNCTLDFYF